jgi:hypothetical protein
MTDFGQIKKWREEKSQVNLPVTSFMYTLDQIGSLLGLREFEITRSYIHFDGRSPGIRPLTRMIARNIAGPLEKPEWRVADKEFVRWLKYMGFQIFERGYITD